MLQIDEIITDFQKLGWKSEPFERTMSLAQQNPELVASFIKAVVTRIPKGGTFHDAAMSFLQESDWPDVVEHALNALTDNRQNEAAHAVIGYATLQCVQALRPHLHRIFELQPNAGCYDEHWPWRESEITSFNFLKAIVEDDSTTPERRRDAWMCLLETRHQEVIEYAITVERDIDLNLQMRQYGLPENLDLNTYLWEVGLEFRDGLLRRLDSDDAFHVLFPKDYFSPNRPRWLRRDVHPTWIDDRCVVGEARIGGAGTTTCGRCGDRTHRLIEFAPNCCATGIVGLPSLSIETCLSCLGWEAPNLFYRHDGNGSPKCLAEPCATRPQFPATHLKDCQVKFGNLGSRWRWQSWGAANSRENLNRIGGHPTWVQSADYLQCPVCESTMRFLLQFDSDWPTADQGEWLWGSGGMAYVFWCDHCRISGLHWQCT